MAPGDFLPVAGAVRAASSLAESEAAKNLIILQRKIILMKKGATTFSMMTLCTTTFSIMKLSITPSVIML